MSRTAHSNKQLQQEPSFRRRKKGCSDLTMPGSVQIFKGCVNFKLSFTFSPERACAIGCELAARAGGYGGYWRRKWGNWVPTGYLPLRWTRVLSYFTENIGSGAWTRTRILGSKGPCATNCTTPE